MTFLDPALAGIHKAEVEARLPFIVPEEFYVTYKAMPDGTQKPVEWVRWIKKGQQNPTAVPERIKDLMRNPNNPTWQVLKPYYEKWKEGQGAVITGTPLDAWMANPRLVKVLNSVNIRSVEDFAEMIESDLNKLSVPGLRDIQKRAKMYLEARQTTAPLADKVAELQKDLEHQRRENDELRQLIADRLTKLEEEEPAKRGPGRPRKNPEPEAA